MSRTVFVPSEVDVLRKVIVHKPDEGISRVSPKRSDELLFDDIVFLPKMREEHQIFVNTLQAFLGAENVLETEDLIFETLEHSAEGREDILSQIAIFEELPRSFIREIEVLDNKTLAKTLITGYIEEEELILFDPIPNFIFTRDIAVVVNDHVIISKAAREARHRENLLTRLIFRYHPMFEHLHTENKIINLNKVDLFPPSRSGEAVSVEGGDMMLINSDYLLIGRSERTTMHAFHSIRKVLFERNIVRHVVMVNVPAERAFMHIDTIFTQIDFNHIVAYKPIVIDGMSSYVEVHNKNGSTRFYGSIREFFVREISPHFQFILAGQGRSPYQEREQWTDGCNLVAVKPGVAITYDRNIRTAKAFTELGYRIIRAKAFLEESRKDPAFAQSLEKTIITLPSSELSRARGGSHCMTCPILRG